PHVVAATAWALAGEGEKCREHIRTAINIGWLCGIAQLRALWPELLASQAIWENPAWCDLLDRLEPEAENRDTVPPR
ncbi:MAG: hypothetical protein PHW86_07710, partial [Candidatus Bipolaricaulis sp.]|nr:hypothetical protein [Candidatus Bipolaricaulis sp.]